MTIRDDIMLKCKAMGWTWGLMVTPRDYIVLTNAAERVRSLARGTVDLPPLWQYEQQEKNRIINETARALERWAEEGI